MVSRKNYDKNVLGYLVHRASHRNKIFSTQISLELLFLGDQVSGTVQGTRLTGVKRAFPTAAVGVMSYNPCKKVRVTSGPSTVRAVGAAITSYTMSRSPSSVEEENTKRQEGASDRSMVRGTKRRPQRCGGQATAQRSGMGRRTP